VQGEQLGKTERAIHALDRVLTILPGDGSARASRGVLFARLGNKEAALADATAILQQRPLADPLHIYQAGCTYALLGADNPQLRAMALNVVQRAAFLQPDLVKTAFNDPDLTNLREEPRFQQLIKPYAKAASAQP
jgi:tetratricopeptide (TPR) repeat protein